MHINPQKAITGGAEMLQNVPLAIREALPNDLNLVFNSWLSSFKGSKTVGNVAAPFYWQGQHNIIERCLRQAHTVVLVDANNTENIYGYLVYEHIDNIFTVHYCYVKHVFRHLGLMRMMVDEVRGSSPTGLYTHDSRTARFVAEKLNLFFNPYILHERLAPLRKTDEPLKKFDPKEFQKPELAELSGQLERSRPDFEEGD